MQDKPTVPPDELVTPQRIDIITKYIYARHLRLGVEDVWASHLYTSHIDVFNGFVEADGSGKHGAKGYINSF